MIFSSAEREAGPQRPWHRVAPPKTRFRLPIWHQGSIGAAINNYPLAIISGLLPLALIGLTIYQLIKPHPLVYFEEPFYYTMWMLALVGLATAPCVYFIAKRVNNGEAEAFGLVLLSCLFPIWLVPFSLLGLCILAPATCTIGWAIMLSMIFGRRRATHFALLQTLPASISLFVLPNYLPYSMGDTIVAPTVLVWHLTHPFTLAIIAELTKQDLKFLESICNTCGYPREGLAPPDPCPECGRPHFVSS